MYIDWLIDKPSFSLGDFKVCLFEIIDWPECPTVWRHWAVPVFRLWDDRC